MTEKIMDINSISSYLETTLRAKKVRVKEAERVITIIPIDDEKANKKFNCPFLGIAAESSLTVDKFLEWKREERESEHDKELRS